MARALIPFLLLCCAGPCMAGGAAGPVGDPTVPTPGNAAAAPRAEGASAPVEPESVRLQMVLAHGGERAAVIGGRTVHAGDLVEVEGGMARVQQIADASVVLQRGSERVVLDLLESPAAVRRHVECPGANSAPCRKP
jgi:hypothetical protein